MTKLKVRCEKCQHEFDIDVELPMEVKQFGRLVKKTSCPNCGAGSNQIALVTAKKEE